MSDALYTDIPFSAYDDYSRRTREVKAKKTNVKKDKKVTVLKIFVVVIAILLLAEVLVMTVIVPGFTTVHIQFTGISRIPMEKLEAKVNEFGGSTWIQFDTAKAVSVVGSMPEVERVTVDKHFPDRVVIDIKEREPVAKTILYSNGHPVTVQIDQNGVLFTSDTVSVVRDTSIPLISGLPLDNVQEGMRLPSVYRTLMEHVSEIRRLPQKYFAAISEIQVVPKEFGNYELVVYPIHTHVRVLVDNTLNEDALKYMMVVLDVVNSIEPDVSEIDLRYGSVSYRKH